MGWTVFACFGCTKKRKRPKIRRRIQGYKALKSDTHTEQDVSKSLSISREKPSDETKERIRKKVRFNLEVVTYEPLSSYDEDHDNSWDDRNEETEQAAATSGVCLISTESNYRYNNCYVGEDEYDYDCDDDDLISDDEDEEDEEDYAHDSGDDGCILDLQNIYHEESTEDLHDCSSRPLISSASNTRLRSHYIVPVLNPIHNLSQWKAIKSRKC